MAIVVKSLVPGGVAHQDGRLVPGDRLLFVNDVWLENATLEMAVEALKGAPRGPVRIGLAKALPLASAGSPSASLDASSSSPTAAATSTTTSAAAEEPDVPLDARTRGSLSRASGLGAALSLAPELSSGPAPATATATAAASFTLANFSPSISPRFFGDHGVRSVALVDGLEIPALPRELEQFLRVKKGTERFGVLFVAAHQSACSVNSTVHSANISRFVGNSLTLFALCSYKP